MKKIVYDGPQRVTSEQEIKRRRKYKCIVLIVVITFLMSMLSGCIGFVGPDRSGKNTPYTAGAQGGENALCSVWDDAVSCGPDELNGLSAKSIDAKDDSNGSRVRGDSGFTVLRDVAAFLYSTVFGDTYSDNFTGDTDFGSIPSLYPADVVIQVNNLTSSALGSAGGLSAITGAVQGMAAAILIAVWAMGFISQIVDEKFSMETLLKTLMQLMCGIVLITNATTIVSAFAAAGNAVANAIPPGAASNNGSAASAVAAFLQNGIFAVSFGFTVASMPLAIGTVWIDYSSLFMILLLLVPLWAQIQCVIKIVSISITRMLELAARITLAPIPLAFGAQKGFSQSAIGYFREVMACALQPVLMMIGVACMGPITDVLTSIFGSSGMISGIIATTVAYNVLSAYLGETRHMARDIVK